MATHESSGDETNGLGQNSYSTRTTTTTTTCAAKIKQDLTSTTSKPSSSAASSKESERRESLSTSVYLTDEEIGKLSTDETIQSIRRLESSLKEVQGEWEKAEESREKLKEELLKAEGRENLLILKLAVKEREMADSSKQLRELKKTIVPGESLLEKIRVDPAVNLVFERMRKEVSEAKVRVEDMQNELSAWKFTPDSNMGKRLMAKCKQLYQENEDLGRMISTGKIAKLENELAFQKNFADEIKKSQSEIDDFLVELDEDFDGMQTTISSLQAQLREAKEQLKLAVNGNVPDLNVIEGSNQNVPVPDSCGSRSHLDKQEPLDDDKPIEKRMKTSDDQEPNHD